VSVGVLGRSGRSPIDRRDIGLRSIVSASAGSPPFIRDWSPSARLPWLCNDAIGCCTIAGIGHLLQIQAMQRAEIVSFTDQEIVTAYSQSAGYLPGHPETDSGGLMISALKLARDEGIGAYRVGAFARVNPHDRLEMQTAINFFGGVYVGAELPSRITEQITRWEVPERQTIADDPGSLGGHAYVLSGYDRSGYHARPWREDVYQTVTHVERYVDEAWVVIDDQWVTGESPAPVGLDLEALNELLMRIGEVA
jgi:hypothetical protein